MNDYVSFDQQNTQIQTHGQSSAQPSQTLAAQVKTRHLSLVGMMSWIIALLALLVLVVQIVVLVILFGERRYDGHIYPNVHVRGLDLSNHSVEAAHTTLHQRYATLLQNPMTLVYDDQVWKPNARQLGLRLKIDAAVAEALSIGRQDTRANNTQTVAALLEQGVDVPLHVEIDQQVMQRYLLDIARTIERPLRDADIVVEGSHIKVTTEQFGLQVLVDQTMQAMIESLHELQPQHITLHTRPLVPAVRDTDVEQIVPQVTRVFSGSIDLHATGAGQCQSLCQWVWHPEQIAEWVRIQKTHLENGRTKFQLIVDQTALRKALIPIAEMVHEDGILPRLQWEDGHLSIIRPGQLGRGLDVNTALAQMNAALQGESRSLELPLTDIAPPVTAADLPHLNLSTLVGVGVSSFSGSAPYRITNIQAGARRLHGLLIPPGQEFSFNQSVEPVDASGGFVIGSAIIQNRTQQEWGGGLCQVSTTMFRSAFWAGLPITERHEHNFRIRWYEYLGEPPGLDAAIYTGFSDLRFINDTNGYLLIQTWVDTQRQRLYISLIGQPSERHVTMSYSILRRTHAPARPVYINDPSLPRGVFRHTDIAQGGMTVEVYRTIRLGDQIMGQDTFPTTFKPWPNIYVRGTG